MAQEYTYDCTKIIVAILLAVSGPFSSIEGADIGAGLREARTAGNFKTESAFEVVSQQDLARPQASISTLYVTRPVYRDNKIDVVNPDDGSAIATITPTTGNSYTHYVISSPDGRRAYISSSTANSIFVVDRATNSVVATLPATQGAGPMAASPDGALT